MIKEENEYVRKMEKNVTKRRKRIDEKNNRTTKENIKESFSKNIFEVSYPDKINGTFIVFNFHEMIF